MLGKERVSFQSAKLNPDFLIGPERIGFTSSIPKQ
jgi:hypothetical protein